MTMTTKAHNREINEYIEVAGTDFNISMDREEWKLDRDDERKREWKITLFWHLDGFGLRMNVTCGVDDGAEAVEYFYIPAGGKSETKFANARKMAELLSLDEKRKMLCAIAELNEWSKMNSNLPELGNWVWRIARDAKLSEVEV
ncbi:MAG: hypothetical protein IKZ87_04660 [Actinomycetaceae bacterium]|nr:hypothetical protein [Actinomycetaceae bacterium]